MFNIQVKGPGNGEWKTIFTAISLRSAEAAIEELEAAYNSPAFCIVSAERDPDAWCPTCGSGAGIPCPVGSHCDDL